ncbi:MAG: hypothetical protein WD696_23390 [Bryobacteraceae bacterium]
MESVTWDLKSHKLIWVVETGQVQNGEFKAKESKRYEITPDDAVMTVAQERRGFTKEEASALHKLLDTLALYCAESVIWWDKGEGNKIEGPNSSAPIARLFRSVAATLNIPPAAAPAPRK